MKRFTIEIKTGNPNDTAMLGRKLSSELKPGDVLALYGDLAAGKTTLTRGLAEGFHANQPATSPTFTLINEYPGTVTLYHFDCYRIRDAREILYLGFEEYLDMEGIVVVEWPQKVEEFLPDETIRIHLNLSPAGDNIRLITIDSPRELPLDFSN
ncbi:MAG TPA: tRNA (adenosine(37)-N6)-threonylcarbamoyltransferase complex ATPase subunit type 1 TsaE [Candidatus Marinimicrobia bacterium]|nr:tRNA (adenosine(37)-N6)-threonylcarbamoyltransferase complex ATPase subunit type 1 TsaE [Candidatus Neomarinimicrobiota bacterium]